MVGGKLASHMPEMSKKIISFNIIANAVLGFEGLSGGDNIFINFAKGLSKHGFEVNIFTWEDGFLMCKKNKLASVNFFLSTADKYKKLPFPLFYLVRTILGVSKIFSVVRSGFFKDKMVFVYSASDFYPDSIPAMFMRRFLPRSSWLAGFYLFAPNPISGFRGALRKKFNFPSLSNIFYWLSQKPIYYLVKKYADMVFVTSEPDIPHFLTSRIKKNDIFVVRGGIDYSHFLKYQKKIKKAYEAVYLGRFHPQKGVSEMIDIWRLVVNEIPNAKLAVIGFGPMEEEMKDKIQKYDLKKNVVFFGPMIGDNRDRILQKSSIVLHPALYDSGGMAAASGLACGLPGVCFDLPVFKTYYPKGFLRANIGDIKDFAKKILSLLGDKELYQSIRKESIEEAKTWDWSYKTNALIDIIHRRL